MKKRYDTITEAGQKIKQLVEENLKSFCGDPSSTTWQNYIEYLDEMVVEGFFQCILCSLNFVLTNTDAKLVHFPLFEARLELQAPEMVFVPSLNFNVPGGFYDMMEDILSDFYQQASLVNRLASHYDSTDYQVKKYVFENNYFILKQLRWESAPSFRQTFYKLSMQFPIMK